MSDYNNTPSQDNTQPRVGNMRTYTNESELPEAIRPMVNPSMPRQSMFGQTYQQPMQDPTQQYANVVGSAIDSVDVYLELLNKKKNDIMLVDVSQMANLLLNFGRVGKFTLRRKDVVFIRHPMQPGFAVVTLLPSGNEIVLSAGDTLSSALLAIVTRTDNKSESATEADVLAFAEAVDEMVAEIKEKHNHLTQTNESDTQS